jgi:amidase
MGLGNDADGSAAGAKAGSSGLVGRSAVELAAAVRAKEVDPVEVVSAHLDRIDSLNGMIGAFVVTRQEAVLAEARALAERDDLAGLPLAGVPLATKDDVDLAGLATRRGSAATSPEPAAADAEMVRRLRDAGALLVGKTRLPELGLWHFSEPAAFGPARNPWDLSRTPGGSSGGSAAAVSSGMVPLGLGSDGAGSIRIPASCCGLVGIKPGPGVVPQPGVTPHWDGMTEWGALATTVDDAALMLAILAGTAEKTGNTGGLSAGAVSLPDRALRIAVSTRSPAAGVRVDPAIRAGTAEVADELAGAGHAVDWADPPIRQTDALTVIRQIFAGAAETAQGLSEAKLERRTHRQARAGRLVRGYAPRHRIDGIRARLTAWFDGYDLLLSPITATPPPRVGAYDGHGLARTLLEATTFIPFTPPWNLVGFPTVAVPAGRTPDGLPFGVQLVAPRGGESLLLSVAAQLEQLRPWPRHAPMAQPAGGSAASGANPGGGFGPGGAG